MQNDCTSCSWAEAGRGTERYREDLAMTGSPFQEQMHHALWRIVCGQAVRV